MSNRDICFLGFVALAYLYLDQRRSARSPERVPAPGRPLQIRIVPRDACPRNGAHPVSRRPDGAMWCRRCDEAYYPHVAEWETGLAGAA